MRYVKTYESFGSLKSEVEDILRELEDDDIRVDVNDWEQGFFGKEETKFYDFLNIFLTNTKEHKFGNFTAPELFPYSLIEPNIEHLVSFLKEKGFIIKKVYNIINLQPSMVDFEDLKDMYIGRLELNFIR